MPITKTDGVLVETPVIDKDQFERTGVIRDDSFAICDEKSKTKQLKFSVGHQAVDKAVTLKTNALQSDNIEVTLPSESGTLVTVDGIGGVAFTTIQADEGTSPVATTATDTLTLTSSDDNIVVTGNATTDTIDLTANPTQKITTLEVSTIRETEDLDGLETYTRDATGADSSTDIIETTGMAETGTSGDIYKATGDVSGAGTSGDATFGTGDSGGTSGHTTIMTGSASGTRGNVVLDGASVVLSHHTATRVPYVDANKKLTPSAVTPTELDFVSGVTSAIQTQLGTKQVKATFLSSHLANPTRVTGAAPTALGEYRSMLRDGSARTFSDTNGSPTFTPTTASGFRIYNCNAWANIDNSNEPSWYQFYIGTNVTGFTVVAYAGTSKSSGGRQINPVTIGSAYVGYNIIYDAAIGTITFVPLTSAAHASHSSGFDTNGNTVNDLYIDVAYWTAA